METCKKCNRTKTWKGDDIKCPFQNSDTFGDNWNCGIIGKIRRLCDIAMEWDNHPKLSYQYCEDQNCVMIKTYDVIEGSFSLWVTWYKSRGKTDAMWLLDDEKPPRKPTFDELKQIVEYYENIGELV